jgi:ABC-2 type transport system ATP-binding protein
MTAAAIQIDAVTKRYWKIRERSLLRSLVPFGPPNRQALWALRDIDLRVEPGETLGVIGRNGAGKSTLLRLLAGVTRPTEGTVVTRGRVAPLLSVGVGFHREMTGRENIYVNGMLLGFGKSRIQGLFDEIVEFAELGDFIDTPVKFYSSGMFMRLGFSVAMHVEPDVLLVDEVLAVGDIAFRLRCFERMREMQQSGTALVFVSHWIGAVQVLCPRTICMDHGRIAFDGRTEDAIASYHDLLAGTNGEGEGAVRLVDHELTHGDGSRIAAAHQDDLLRYRARLRFEEPVESPQLHFRVIAEDGTLAYGMQTEIGGHWRSFAAGEEATVEVLFRVRLAGGNYQIATRVTDTDMSTTLVHDQAGPSFFVTPRLGTLGISDLDATITIDGVRRTDHGSLRFENHPTAVEGA